MNIHEKELFEKVASTIKERTIKTLEGKFSIFKKELVLIINGIEHNLSSSISDEIWRKGVGDNIYMINHPEVNFEIRVELSKVANGYLKWFDPTFEGLVIL